MAPKVTIYALGGPGGGPNPKKCYIYLNKLGVEYNAVPLEFSADEKKGVKGADFFKVNPNGRVPALVDHDENDLTIWESGAILNYLSEKFDPNGVLSGKNLAERAQIQTWLFYQVSGMGPVQGQCVYMDRYFKATYGEDPSDLVKKRFRDEIARIYKVLDGQLEQQKSANSEFIVLNRMTVVDIAFYGWVSMADFCQIDLSLYPSVQAWSKMMEKDEAVLEVGKRFPAAQ